MRVDRWLQEDDERGETMGREHGIANAVYAVVGHYDHSNGAHNRVGTEKG